MLISGLQKLTLLDYPGKVACTVFTGGCNFRCPFCHNSALVPPGQLSQGPGTQEILAFLKKRVGVLDGVAVTGGEPLLHPDIGDFLREVKGLGFLVKLDTNGEWASTTFQVLTTAQGSASPRTGDESNLGLWAAFLLLSGTAVVVLIPKLRKHDF